MGREERCDETTEGTEARCAEQPDSAREQHLQQPKEAQQGSRQAYEEEDAWDMTTPDGGASARSEHGSGTSSSGPRACRSHVGTHEGSRACSHPDSGSHTPSSNTGTSGHVDGGCGDALEPLAVYRDLYFGRRGLGDLDDDGTAQLSVFDRIKPGATPAGPRVLYWWETLQGAELEHCHAAATRIQAAWRGYAARRVVARLRAEARARAAADAERRRLKWLAAQVWLARRVLCVCGMRDASVGRVLVCAGGEGGRGC